MKKIKLSITILLGWLVLFALIPITLIIITSLLTPSYSKTVTLPFTLANYHVLFSPVFVRILWRSLLFGITITSLSILLAYPFSWLIARSPHRSLFLFLIIVPFWTSSLIRSYALIALLKYKGLINSLLLKLHIISQPMTLLYTNTAVIIGLVYTLLPYMILPISLQIEQFDFKLIDAAKDLGAKNSTIFYKIILPVTMPGIIAGSLLVFLPAMTLFYIPNLLGGAKSFLVGNLIQQQLLVIGNWPQGAATSVLLTVFLLVFAAVLSRQQKDSS